MAKRVSSIRERVEALRAQMKQAGVDAYLIPSVDPHQSEYVPECWQRRPWISGFTGSAGDVVVTLTDAGLWTDGRYFIQAARELRGSGIRLFKQGRPKVPSISTWLAKTLKPGSSVGADARVISTALEQRLAAALEPAQIKLKLNDTNLVDKVWTNQPKLPLELIQPHPSRYAGKSVAAKLRDLRKALAARGAFAHPITTLDGIAWLFNIRGSDVPFNPVAIANALVTDKQAYLFCDPKKVDAKLRKHLSPQVKIRPYAEFNKRVRQLARAKRAVWIDSGSASVSLVRKLKGTRVISEPSPLLRPKAAKNRVEVAGSQAAHVRDGAAMVRFLCWLESAVGKQSLGEIAVADKLRSFRAQDPLYRGDSFSTIAGYAGNGAIVHYSATPATEKKLRKDGVFLIDSGGQYLDGTTDITRTVLLGRKASAALRDRYTRVLQGHIDLACARFPRGTAGRQLDTIARVPLWQAGLNYAHGTGHGVGSYLCVHEGPQSLNTARCQGFALEPGNILSDEPGYYEADAYGIRIENLLVVVESARDGFLEFDVLTLCPIDTRMIDARRLSADQRSWFNAYHRRVRRELGPLVTGAERRWLQRATKPI